MRKILGLLMMLFSLYGFAGTAVGEVEANQVVDVILEKGNSDKKDSQGVIEGRKFTIKPEN